MALRGSIFMVSVSLASLAACTTSTPAPIDYRTASKGDPTHAAVPARTVMASATTVPAARPPATRAPSAAPSQPSPRPAPGASSSPAVQEAAALAPESAPRPGGPMRAPKDEAQRRAIQVQGGDTVYDIARKYNINMRALIETNQLEAPYTLNPGQTVWLPPPNVHVVERGETLYSVSRRYNIDTRSLAMMNGLSKPWTIYPGDEVVLPPLARDQERVQQVAAVTVSPVTQPSPQAAPPAPAAPPPTPKQTLQTQPSPQLAAAPPPKIAPVAAPALAGAPTGPAGPISLTPPAPKPVTGLKVVAGAAGGGQFVWPVSGAIASAFGVSSTGARNDGVNIDAAPGSEVRSAAAGEVVYSGNELSGFGNLLLIRHSDGWVTAYAHAEKLLVKEGDKVAQGQPIAMAGGAGKPQIHFELRKGKDPVDPLSQLPAPQS